MWLLNWIKAKGAKSLILQLDRLVPVISAKIVKAQRALNDVPPEQFAKELVDEMQIELCKLAGVDPEGVTKQ
jgi:hypothetical protein